MSYQHYLRDSGTFKLICDYAAVAIGVVKCIFNPMLLYRHIQMGKAMKTHVYDGNCNHSYLQVYQVSSTSSGNSIIPSVAVDDGNDSNINTIGSDDRRCISDERTLVYVHGGAWGSGKLWMYRLIAYGLAQQVHANTVILIKYKVYPHAYIEDQVTSVINAIDYIKSNESSIHANDDGTSSSAAAATTGNRSYILSGHSSGSNICTLAILRAANNVESILPLSSSAAVTAASTTVTAVASVTNKLVDAFIGLSGVYDIHKHYLYESSRGVHEISPMKPAAGGIDCFHLYSPTQLVLNSLYHIDSHTLPAMCLIHGNSDETVPSSSTAEFAASLASRNIRNVYTYLLPCVDHGQPIIDMLDYVGGCASLSRGCTGCVISKFMSNIE